MNDVHAQFAPKPTHGREMNDVHAQFAPKPKHGREMNDVHAQFAPKPTRWARHGRSTRTGRAHARLERAGLGTKIARGTRQRRGDR